MDYVAVYFAYRIMLENKIQGALSSLEGECMPYILYICEYVATTCIQRAWNMLQCDLYTEYIWRIKYEGLCDPEK
jgi:hypothetical protein